MCPPWWWGDVQELCSRMGRQVGGENQLETGCMVSFSDSAFCFLLCVRWDFSWVHEGKTGNDPTLIECSVIEFLLSGLNSGQDSVDFFGFHPVLDLVEKRIPGLDSLSVPPRASLLRKWNYGGKGSWKWNGEIGLQVLVVWVAIKLLSLTFLILRKWWGEVYALQSDCEGYRLQSVKTP